jgi:arylsulfatase A-like enzyme
VQDALIHVDAHVGALLDKLDRDVGKGNYVVALSSDHGVAPVPERVKAKGFDAGRINTAGIGRAVDEVLQRELGPGTYRTRVQYTQVYFDNGVYERLSQNPRAMAAVIETIRTSDGVASVHRKEELSRLDPLTRPLALSYYEGRNGDMKITTRPYWIASPSTATHGTGHRYDTRVPVMLFGYGIKKGEYIEPVSPIDIAPTLAFLAGVTLPDPMGRVLTEALTTPR